MELMLDTINLDDIRKYHALLPLSGVTSNPTIIKKEGPIDFFSHMLKIREIIGNQSLHIQVVAKDYQGMMDDAHTILERIDRDVFIKVPVTLTGLQVIKDLKAQGVNVTATAIYTKFQAFLAISAGADYLAPYYNRMSNLNIDANETISEIANEIVRSGSHTKILAASFKNVSQVNEAIACGAQSVTVPVEIIETAFAMPSIQQAVDDFERDWCEVFNEDTTIAKLNK